MKHTPNMNTEDVARWTVSGDDFPTMRLCKVGEYVRYVDHAAALSSLSQQVAAQDDTIRLLKESQSELAQRSNRQSETVAARETEIAQLKEQVLYWTKQYEDCENYHNP